MTVPRRDGPDRAAPLTPTEFAAAMAPFAPFEPAPALAVGVSGGADSMALCLLAAAWAHEHGGRVQAFTVDHRLRADSAAEAAAVAGWLAARGIAHATLVWREPAAAGAVQARAGAVQARARAARHALLDGACAARGLLHLLLAHTLEDQAETVLMRLAKGSGVDGLAGMPAERPSGAGRILRPLLGVPKARLVATCRAAGQPWIEDPSNTGQRFARGRLRAVAPALAAEGLAPARLADTARRLGRARAALEAATAELLAGAAAVYPEGYILLDPAPLTAAPAELRLRAMARCLAVVGGGGHPPRRERLERLCAELAGGGPAAGRTLAGCCILPRGDSVGRLLLCREPAAAERRPVPPGSAGRTLWWDRRFRVTLPPAAPATALMLAPLGSAGARRLGDTALPAAVPAALPGLWNTLRLIGFPQMIGYRNRMTGTGLLPIMTEFAPEEGLAGGPFGVV